MTLAPSTFFELLSGIGVELESGEIERLAHYLDLLLDTNTRFNLTAITDRECAWTRHIADSLSLLPLLASAEAKAVIDVGSGGGLPGIPLAIALPEVHFTLLDATGKKAAFLEETATALELTNVDVINDRAENIGRDRENHREQYDAVIARAVGRLAVLLELTVPLARAHGHIFAIKGERAEEEIEQAREALYRLHCHAVDTRRTTTGTIIILEKQRTTPKIYPRRPGEPKRAPIGGTDQPSPSAS